MWNITLEIVKLINLEFLIFADKSWMVDCSFKKVILSIEIVIMKNIVLKQILKKEVVKWKWIVGFIAAFKMAVV